MTADLEPRQLAARLAAAGATFTLRPDGSLKVAAPKGVLTPDVVEALRVHKQAVVSLVVWDQNTAEMLIREALDRVAAAFRPEWAAGYQADDRWLVPQARVEAAALTHDMAGFVAAVEAYEKFAHAAFSEYAGASRYHAGNRQHEAGDA